MTQSMEERGCEMQYIDPNDLQKDFDAVLMATGATKPFDPSGRNPGRDLKGIHFAMDFLTRNTKSLLDSNLEDGEYLTAKDKHVIVIGGGDTGADCIGTSLRHDCKDVVNFELLDQPPVERADNNPWPQWPRVYRLDYSHEENKAKNGDDPRAYHILAKEFVDDGNGHIKGVKTVEVDWSKPVEGGAPFSEVEGSEKEWPADLVCSPPASLGPNWKSAKCSDSRRRTRVVIGRPLLGITANLPPTWKVCLLRATVAVANRSSFGPSTKDAVPHAPLINTSWAVACFPPRASPRAAH